MDGPQINGWSDRNCIVLCLIDLEGEFLSYFKTRGWNDHNKC